MKRFYSTLGIDSAIKEQERDNIKANQKVNNMLNSTKTWQEEFDKKFVFEHSEDGEFRILYRNTLAKDIIKFISDLRKRDMEALIEYLKESDSNNIYSLIKDYYEK